MSDDKPWWNDQDKAGGMAATITLLGLAILLCLMMLACGVWLLKAAIG